MADLTPLDCNRIEADAVLLLDGGLDALRVDAVHAHFAACPRCAAFFRDLRAVLVLEAEGDFRAPFDAADVAFPRADFDALAARLELADVRALGRLLYEVLKAEFLYDYGDNVEAADEPIEDPMAERQRGAELVEELRDWVDGSRVGDVDLREVARHFERASVDTDRLDTLIRGMGAVRRYAPDLSAKADYYVALAHIKARRPDAAEAALRPLVAGTDAALARLAAITLAVIPGMLRGEAGRSVELLEGCLCGDPYDPIVRFNLAQAVFEAAGGRLTAEVDVHLAAARTQAPGLVERQLAVPSARRLRLALAAR